MMTDCSQFCRMRGFSLITGIFLLVILSALGAFMVVFTGQQQSTIQADVLGVRSYYAARTGIEWALYQALDPESTVAPAPPWPPLPFAACPAGTIALGTMGGSLASFSVTVACTSTDTTEGSTRHIRTYQITATACNQAVCPGAPGPGYIERVVTVTAAKCKDSAGESPRYAC